MRKSFFFKLYNNKSIYLLLGLVYSLKMRSHWLVRNVRKKMNFVLSGCCRFILTVLLSKRTEGCKDRLVNHGFFRDCSGTRLRPSIVSRNKSVLLHSLFIGVSCKKADESCSSTAVTSTAEKEATIQSLHTFRGSKWNFSKYVSFERDTNGHDSAFQNSIPSGHPN